MTAMDSALHKIPFGYHQATDKFVDVSEVPRGVSCDCICPSCRLPLKANQGEVNQWYFSHYTRALDIETKKECDYSFYVSVRYMAKQIFSEAGGERIVLPSYTKDFETQVEGTFKRVSGRVQVTEASTVNLDTITVDHVVKGVQVDIAATVKGHDLFFCFSHPTYEPKYPIISDLPDGAGLIEIGLTNSYELLLGRRSTFSFKEQLKTMLFDNEHCKRWIFHARENRLIESKSKKLCESYWDTANKQKCDSKDDAIDASNQRIINEGTANSLTFRPLGGKEQMTVCGRCRFKYFGSYYVKMACPKCGL